MKKKLLTLGLVICLAATAIIGGTMAYFTDTDGAKNVMTVGNVSIVQHETDSEGNAFVNNTQKLYPVTGNEVVAAEKAEFGNVRADGQNWIDKIVTVQNDGSEKAYIRTLFAFQMLEEKDEQGNVINYLDPMDAFDTHALSVEHTPADSMNSEDFIYPVNANDGVDMGQYYGSGTDYCCLELNGHKYVVAVWYYANNGDSSLLPGEFSVPSMKQVGLEKEVTNEQAKYFENYEILVVSQAVQTKGFTDAKTALNEAFGDVATVKQETLQKWFSNAK